jgi:hypothetical protein
MSRKSMVRTEGQVLTLDSKKKGEVKKTGTGEVEEEAVDEGREKLENEKREEECEKRMEQKRLYIRRDIKSKKKIFSLFSTPFQTHTISLSFQSFRYPGDKQSRREGNNSKGNTGRVSISSRSSGGWRRNLSIPLRSSLSRR